MSIFNNVFEIRPGQDGSFIVTSGGLEQGQMRQFWAFSNISDLRAWLGGQSDAFSWTEQSPQLRAALGATMAKQAATAARMADVQGGPNNKG